MDPEQANTWLSAPRFEPFLSAAEGNHVRAVALYDWHAEIAAACFGTIHHFEVLLRNAIDGVLGENQPQQPLKDTWLMDFDVLQPDDSASGPACLANATRSSGATDFVTPSPKARSCAKTSPSRCACSSAFGIASPTMTVCSGRTSKGERTTCLKLPGGSTWTPEPGSNPTPRFTTCLPKGRDRDHAGARLKGRGRPAGEVEAGVEVVEVPGGSARP